MTTCCIEGCDRPVKVKSTQLCHPHDMQMRRHGEIKPPAKMQVCSVDDCQRAAWANGMCKAHDMQKKRTGSPLTEAARLRQEVTQLRAGIARALECLPGRGEDAEELLSRLLAGGTG
jgi:hypothetical protein